MNATVKRNAAIIRKFEGCSRAEARRIAQANYRETNALAREQRELDRLQAWIVVGAESNPNRGKRPLAYGGWYQSKPTTDQVVVKSEAIKPDESDARKAWSKTFGKGRVRTIKFEMPDTRTPKQAQHDRWIASLTDEQKAKREELDAKGMLKPRKVELNLDDTHAGRGW